MVRVAPDLTLRVEERGDGPALLLLHGFTGSARSWDAVAAAFAARSRVLAPDLIGHGQSDAPSDARRYAIGLAARDLAALLDALGVARASVLGYSLGGRLALRFALDHPERVAALVLVSTSAGIVDPEERARRGASDGELAAFIEREGVARFVERWEREPVLASLRALPPAARDALRATRLGQRAHGLANSLRGMGAAAGEPLWDRLAEVRAPTLVVTGALDERYAAIGARLAAGIRGGRQAVVPEAGHAPQLERPDAFAGLVRDFLADAARRQENVEVRT